MCDKRGSKYGAVSHPASRATCRLRETLRVWGLLLVLAALALEAVGCSNWFRPVEWPELGPQSEKQKSPYRVYPRRGMSMARLSPDDIVRIMQRIGFANEQILELGTDLHNALRFSGGAEIAHKKDKLALFVADGDYVRIRSLSGTFHYEVSTGQFVSPPVSDR